MKETIGNTNPTPFPELHSEEVHEIISRPPNWLVRWGITLFFGLMIILIGAGWYDILILFPYHLH